MSTTKIESLWMTQDRLRAVCKLVMGPYGPSHRCGYVELPLGFPVITIDGAIDYDTIGVEVHGGLTYGGSLKGFPKTTENTLARSLGFVEHSGLWVGFDCAHDGDAFITAPSTLRHHTGVVRDLDYVVDECERLAQQLMEIHKDTKK